MSKDTFYFSHDYNVRNDIKIKKLIAKHGYLGYGVFWAIIEDLYNNANALPLDYECIAYDTRTNENIIQSIINDFDLFIIENGFFGSISVERRLDKRNEKSLKAKESADKRWNKLKHNANALQSDSDSNAIKESKVNESKENEIFKTEIISKNEIYGKELLEGESWVETISMQNKIKIDEVSNWISEFNKKLISELDNKISKKEYAGHFSRWLPGEILKSKKGNPKEPSFSSNRT